MPIELSNVRAVASFQETSIGSTPARRAKREKIFAAAREPVVFTMRRSRTSKGLRKGEQTTWRRGAYPRYFPRSTSATYVVWTSPLRIVIEAGGRPLEADGDRAEKFDEAAKRELVRRPVLEIDGSS